MKIEKFVNESILFSLLKSADHIRSRINHSLEGQEINFYQSLILISLYTDSKSKLEPSDFVYAFSISKSIVSQSLTKLEELKLIKRSVNEVDARRTTLLLTPKGGKKSLSIMGILHELDNEMESSLKKSEVKELLSL